LEQAHPVSLADLTPDKTPPAGKSSLVKSLVSRQPFFRQQIFNRVAPRVKTLTPERFSNG
jgi:hypothetical protein